MLDTQALAFFILKNLPPGLVWMHVITIATPQDLCRGPCFAEKLAIFLVKGTQHGNQGNAGINLPKVNF